MSNCGLPGRASLLGWKHQEELVPHGYWKGIAIYMEKLWTKIIPIQCCMFIDVLQAFHRWLVYCHRLASIPPQGLWTQTLSCAGPAAQNKISCRAEHLMLREQPLLTEVFEHIWAIRGWMEAAKKYQYSGKLGAQELLRFLNQMVLITQILDDDSKVDCLGWVETTNPWPIGAASLSPSLDPRIDGFKGQKTNRCL